MRRPTKAWTDKLANRRGTPEIDLTLPGFAILTGRPSDRVRLASRTTDPAIFTRRTHLVRWLFEHHLEALIIALIERRTTFRLVEAAQARGLAALKALADDKAAPLLIDCITAWYEGYRKAKREEVRDHLFVFYRWCLAALRREPTVLALTSEHAMQFLAELGRQDNKKSKPALAGSTINRYRASLSLFATWAVNAKRLPDNPITRRKVPPMPESRPRMPVLRPSEVRVYLDAIFAARVRRTTAVDAHRRALVLALCVTTGADVGEVLAMKPSDITWSFTDLEPTAATIIFRRGKTNTRERAVPLAESRTLAALCLQLPAKAGARIFADLDRNALWAVHVQGIAACGHDDVSIKDLRHIAAQMWRRAGADLQQVCELLGHTSLDQTMIYAAFGPDSDLDTPVIRQLAVLLSAPSHSPETSDAPSPATDP